MIENLIQLIRQQGAEPVVNNPEVPNEYNNAVLADATQSIVSGLQQSLAGGGLQSVLSLFTGAGNTNAASAGMAGLLSNPAVAGIVTTFVQKLVSNYGISAGQANNIAGSLIPAVLNNLARKTNDPGDPSFNINGIFNTLTGGNTGGFDLQGLLNQFLSNNAGTTQAQPDLSALTGNIAEAARQQQDNSSDPLTTMIQALLK